MSALRVPRIGVTMGDPAGIGPEIIAKALPRLSLLGQITVIGDGWVFEKAAAKWPVPGRVSFDFVEMANVPRRDFSWGRPRRQYGKASLEFIDCALSLLKKGIIDCLVTCPVSKEAVSLDAPGFSGHTGYLSERLGSSKTVMILLNRRLTFGLVTQHVALKDVWRVITRSTVEAAVTSTDSALRKYFKLRRPRLAACGLNPHASDNGLFGSEEKDIIVPALSRCRRRGIDIEGPLPADAACSHAAEGGYDGVVAMYHDQALIPLKLTDPWSGVNLTAGLPFVRTSPLHGTAFDIAGKGRALPGSLIAAAETARRCWVNLKKA